MLKIFKTVAIFIATLVLQSYLLIKSRKLIKLLIIWLKKVLKGQ